MKLAAELKLTICVCRAITCAFCSGGSSSIWAGVRLMTFSSRAAQDAQPSSCLKGASRRAARRWFSRSLIWTVCCTGCLSGKQRRIRGHGSFGATTFACLPKTQSRTSDRHTHTRRDKQSTAASTFVLVQSRLPSSRRRRLLQRLLLLPRVRRRGRGLVPRVYLRWQPAVLLIHRWLLRRPILVLRGRGRLLLSRVRVSSPRPCGVLHGRRHIRTTAARRRIHRRRRPVGRRWLQVLLRLPVLGRGLLLVLRGRLLLLLRRRRLVLRRRLRLGRSGRRLQRAIGARRRDHAQEDLGLEQGLCQLRILHHDLPRLRAQGSAAASVAVFPTHSLQPEC